MTRYEAYKRLIVAKSKMLSATQGVAETDPALVLILDAIRDIDDVKMAIGRTAEDLSPEA